MSLWTRFWRLELRTIGRRLLSSPVACLLGVHADPVLERPCLRPEDGDAASRYVVVYRCPDCFRVIGRQEYRPERSLLAAQARERRGLRIVKGGKVA